MSKLTFFLNIKNLFANTRGKYFFTNFARHLSENDNESITVG